MLRVALGGFAALLMVASPAASAPLAPQPIPVDVTGDLTFCPHAQAPSFGAHSRRSSASRCWVWPCRIDHSTPSQSEPIGAW